MPVFLPNERDKQLLQWMLNQIRNTPVNPPVTWSDRPVERVMPATGSYIAKVSSSGIPALSDTTGTGTPGPPVPGSAVCDIYRVIEHPDGSERTLTQIEGVQKRIFNISNADIGEGYVPVIQQKNGTWTAVAAPLDPMATGTTHVLAFTIESVVGVDSETGFKYVLANVEAQSHEVTGDQASWTPGTGTSPATAHVYDRLGCMFDEPEADLIGRRGYAIRMQAINPDTGTGTPTDMLRYEVFSLCCPSSAGTGT